MNRERECVYHKIYIARAVVHKNMRTLHNYVVSMGSSFYFCNGSLMVGFAISLEIVWTYNTLFGFCEQQGSVLSYFTDHASSHWARLSPIFSLTIPKKQPNKMGMRLQHLDTIPTSCAVLYTHHKSLHTHISLFTATKRIHNYTPTRHSALLTPQTSTEIRICWSVCLDVAVCAMPRSQT